jgi:hypothetical protein
MLTDGVGEISTTSTIACAGVRYTASAADCAKIVGHDRRTRARAAVRETTGPAADARRRAWSRINLSGSGGTSA